MLVFLGETEGDCMMWGSMDTVWGNGTCRVLGAGARRACFCFGSHLSHCPGRWESTRGLKTGSIAYYFKTWINFVFVTSEEAWSSCLLLLHLSPHLLFTFMSFLTMPSSSFFDVYQCNKIRNEEFLRQNCHCCFCVIMFCFSWLNFLTVGIVYISFQSTRTATATRHLNFHLTHLAVSYKLFPRWHQRYWFLLDLTQQCTSVIFEKLIGYCINPVLWVGTCIRLCM